MNKCKHILQQSALIKLRAWLLLPVMCLLFITSAHSQIAPDTLPLPPVKETNPKEEKAKKESIFKGRPGKALLFSLVFPGAGQIYNKSYLRVPFVWAAVGGVGYFMVGNSKLYRYRRDAYKAAIDGTPFPEPFVHSKPFNVTYENLEVASPEAIRIYRDNANANKQQAIIGFAAVWLANGIDAFVDAHLKDFDINEDLSIDIGTRFDEDAFAPMRTGIFVQF